MKRALLGLGAVAVVGLLVLLSGVVSLKASSGHWGVTAWVLDLAKRRSVATWSMGTKVPLLDDPALVLKGAGHYESGCRPCHGAPDAWYSPIPRAMTPHPPDLAREVRTYDPAELFFIVKHGIKFTGMPAWPTPERDDEVWAVVAFLVDLPGMDGETYERLVRVSDEEVLGLPEPVPDPVRDVCARCHGVDGLGRGVGAFPRLAGQNAPYLEATLEAYASGARHSGIMEPVAAALDEEGIRSVSRHYAELPRPGGEGTSRGEEIVTRGIPERRVPPCQDCHGPTEHPRNPHYPLLGGQYPAYITLQLELFQARKRGGTAYVELMRMVTVHDLDPDQVEDVAAYYAALPPEPRR